MSNDRVERKALKIGMLISLIMALAGWVTYYFSGSDAMLLDGNFSFLSVFAAITALFISKKKHEKTKAFPFGSYVYEPLFVLVKGILILGVILVSAIQNSIKILGYIKGRYIEPVTIGPILIYSIVISVLCFILYFYFKAKNNRIGNSSSLMQIEMHSAFVDGILSLGIGIVFLIIWLLPVNTSFEFLRSIGDAIIVLIMCVVFISLPLKIIRESFIELGGGTVQNKAIKTEIEAVISNQIFDGFQQQSTFISKIGSSYFIAVFIKSNTSTINTKEVNLLKQNILNILKLKHQNIQLEIILRD